jgi:hypothetical protein
LFFALVPQKVFIITTIAKSLELAFDYFFLNLFLDLERSGLRGRIGELRVRN